MTHGYWITRRWLCALLLTAMMAGAGAGWAGEAVKLIRPDQKMGGFTFGNGPEFPGAKGALELDSATKHSAEPSLKLSYDLSAGGNYVQAAANLGKTDLDTLSFWIKAPGKDHQTLRVITENGVCHQINFRLNKSDDWQQVVLPIERFFKNMGTPDALEGVLKYEVWGGKDKDKSWKNPATGVVFITGGKGDQAVGAIWLADIAVTRVDASAQTVVLKTERLDDFLNLGEVDWNFVDGREFPGAKGLLTLVKDQPAAGKNALRLAGDFTAGGAYVAAHKEVGADLAGAVTKLRFQMQSDNLKSYGIRLIDGTGQCFQRTNQKFTPGAEWKSMELVPASFSGAEHWGGANDGKWHDPLKAISITVGKNSADDLKPALLLADITAEVSAAAVVEGSSYQEGFEEKDNLGGFAMTGQVAPIKEAPFKGKAALRLSRTEETSNNPVSATGPAFAVTPGMWEFAAAGRGDLYSPDNSYHGEISVQYLNAAGQKTGGETLALLEKKTAWQPFKKRVEVPAGAVKARFVLQLNKTWGTMDVDELSAARLQEKVAPKLIDRLTFDSGKIGTLFYPQDPVVFKVELRSFKPLTDLSRTIRCVVRDYWGGETDVRGEVTVERKGFKDGKFVYEGTLTLDKEKLLEGKYYELHATVELPGAKPYTNYIGLARLAQPETKSFKAEDVPFTIRNWDNRMKEYFFLADRIGIRSLGIWGGWDEKDPKKVHAPGIEWVKELGAIYATGTNAHQVEQGKALTPQSLYEGMTAFLQKYGKDGLHIVCPGNEPHGGFEQKKKNVEAYKAIYEACKAYDKNVTVLSSSMGCDEDYFKLGFQNFCDAYDFHLYEDKNGIRETFRRYDEMMKKYNAVKPVVTTEIGLNSQGMARNVVAADMIQKTAVFFACGGKLFSWFTIMYPDRDGTQGKSFGQAHCTFDSRYLIYSPKIDAITYYNIVNGVGIKKFREEKMYPGDIDAFLFSDDNGNSMIVIWKDKGREDVFLPLPGVEQVKAVQLDGTSNLLATQGKGITLGLNVEPVLVFFTAKGVTLPAALEKPALAFVDAIKPIVKSSTQRFSLRGPGLKPEELVLKLPAGWTAQIRAGAVDTVDCTVTAPEITDARYGRLEAVRMQNGRAVAALHTLIPVTNAFSVEVAPLPAKAGVQGGARLTIRNNGNEEEALRWRFAIDKEFPIKKGNYLLTAGDTPQAYPAQDAEGDFKLAAGSQKVIDLPFAGVQPQSIYAVRAQVTNGAGKLVEAARPVSGFVPVARAPEGMKIDGNLSEAAWQNAPAQLIQDESQYWPMKHVDFDQNEVRWKGAQDLSGKLRFLWDEKYLYLSAEVTDDVFNAPRADSSIWNQDGLQILVDPQRSEEEKPGKYEYSLATGTKGPQAWCNYSADTASPVGEAKDIQIAVRRLDDQTGNIVYEVAIPWSRLAPFKPQSGANLGLSLIVNDDDKTGRDFMGWFSGVHNKELGMVGDLILE